MEVQNNACSDPYQGIDGDESRYSKDTIVWYSIEKFGFAECLKARHAEAGHRESQMVNEQSSGDTNDGVELTKNNHWQRITETMMREHNQSTKKNL